MQDTTLLDRNEPITMDGLRTHFRKHDFSTQTSGYKFKNASSEKNQMYLKAKGIFRTFWEKQMKVLCKKGSLRNFTKDAPIRCLEESEENLVAGTVMELMHKEDHCIALIDQVLTNMQGPMNAEIEKFAQARGKTVQELTEEEFQQAVDAFADEFLSRMMNLLLRVQQVPEILQLSRSASAAEDLVKTRSVNYDLINHDRRWDHQRTQTGPLIPLTPEMEASLPGDYSKTIKEALDYGLDAVESDEEIAQQFLNAFVDTLDNDIDRQILYMRADGKTQAEIATALGYANHSPVTKRLQRLRPKFDTFMERMNGN